MKKKLKLQEDMLYVTRVRYKEKQLKSRKNNYYSSTSAEHQKITFKTKNKPGSN